MDFAGQKLAEQIIAYIFLIAAVGGFLAGYLLGSFQVMAYAMAVGLVLTSLAVLPDWPWYNRNKVTWLPPFKTAGGVVADDKKRS